LNGVTLCFRLTKTPGRRVQPPNPRRETIAGNVEETTRKNVSAAKKIARYAEKGPEIRAKSDAVKRVFSL
jgi:hypothetical protein